MEDENSSVS